MTNITEVWSRKSNEQVLEAATRLTEYSSEAQSAILSEVAQRGLTVEQTITLNALPEPTLVDYYLRGWTQSTVYRARASRKECFTFLIANWAIVVGGLILATSFGGSDAVAVVLLVFFLAAFFPHQAVLVRRIHDTGMSGWWVLIQFIPVVGAVALLGLLLRNPEAGPNQWGDPV